MQAIIVTFVLTCYTVLAGDFDTRYPQYAVYKSFPTALAECAEYHEISSCSVDRIVRTSFPDEREVKKLVRCALLNLRCWNDTTGVQEQVIHSFFNPTPEDSCFLNRTRECIDKFSESKSDVETQAYNAFVCYYRQYGNLNETKQFLPLLPKELDQLILKSLSLASVSDVTLVQFCNGNILNNPKFPEVLLIIFIRGGWFQDGLLLNHLYIQYGNPDILNPQTEQCVNATFNTLPCSADDKELLYRIFLNCLQDKTDTLSSVQRLSRQRLGSNSSCNEGSSGSSTTALSTTGSQALFYNVGPR